jgi:hypothetical protein
MTDTSARDLLGTAERLAQRSRRAARWYAVYLLLYGVGTFALALLIGLAPGPMGVGVGMGVWLVLLIGLTLYQRRQQALIKRFARLHLIVISTWAALWVGTVVVGTVVFVGDLTWWIPAGLVTALPALIGAAYVFRQTR